MENEFGSPRLGVSVSRTCGGAVVRNRLKRLIREAYRQSREVLPAGWDYLVMISPRWQKKTGETNARKAATKLSYEQVRSSLLALVSGAKDKIG